MEILFAPIQPFLWHPERALMVALFFLVFWIFHKIKLYSFVNTPLLVSSISWFLYAALESTISTNSNVRVDILVIYPWLLFISIYSIFNAFKLKNNKNKNESPNT